jgi:hypothetical protein
MGGIYTPVTGDGKLRGEIGGSPWARRAAFESAEFATPVIVAKQSQTSTFMAVTIDENDVHASATRTSSYIPNTLRVYATRAGASFADV